MGCYDQATKARAEVENIEQPGLVELRRYVMTRWPGGMDLGIHYDRPIRGGTAPSLHAEGRAWDWRYADIPNGGGPGPGRVVLDNEILPFLIDHANQLGIQGIGDYTGPSGSQGRFWKRCRNADGSGGGWRDVADSGSGWGQAWADWIHVEMDWVGSKDAQPITTRIGVNPLPPQPPPPAPPGGPYLIGMPPLRKGDKGGQVFTLQSLLNYRIGSGLPLDGDFGTMTETAVKDYQSITGLKCDGFVGDKTWDRLGF
jgi:hypothetical protein